MCVCVHVLSFLYTCSFQPPILLFSATTSPAPRVARLRQTIPGASITGPHKRKQQFTVRCEPTEINVLVFGPEDKAGAPWSGNPTGARTHTSAFGTQLVSASLFGKKKSKHWASVSMDPASNVARVAAHVHWVTSPMMPFAIRRQGVGDGWGWMGVSDWISHMVQQIQNSRWSANCWAW